MLVETVGWALVWYCTCQQPATLQLALEELLAVCFGLTCKEAYGLDTNLAYLEKKRSSDTQHFYTDIADTSAVKKKKT